MKRIIFLVLAFAFAVNHTQARDYKITSPDGRISLTVNTDRQLSWRASFNGTEVIASAKTGLITGDGSVIGVNEKVKKSLNGRVDEVIIPVVSHKRSEIPDNYNFLAISFKSGFSITFRAYNDGIAYRFESSFPDSLIIKEEIAEIQLPSETETWYPLENSFMSHNENTFHYAKLDTINDKHLASLPVLFKANNINVLLTEAAIEDFPGMWIRGGGSGLIKGVWPSYPASERLFSDRNLRVTAVKDYMAKVEGTRSFPWRTFIITPEDGGLVESDLVFRLGIPVRLTETEWIKPGKVAWDWWNFNNIYGVDFRAGLNNETYKYFIDFASENGIEYVILDEGWYNLGDVLSQAPGFDVPELCRYASSKNVGIILWVVFKSLQDKLDESLALYEKWGVKGIKVDFMQRDDQKMVNFYYEATEKAAEHHMLIDFHGAYKPDGFGRTYPNAITREGVKGLEHDKWSSDIDPEHDVTLPFTRMVAGPMDYTPGAMVNMDKANFHPLFSRPASQGTRVHQMALYVIYESPLQMLADNPSNYRREKECTDFIVTLPVVWDDIKVLQARTGDYLLLARRKGSDWYIGGITDWSSRDLEIDFSFLGGGQFLMEIFQDGINADRYASDYKHQFLEVSGGLTMKVHLAPGGGWVAKLTPR